MNFILSSEWRTQFVILTVVSDWWTVSSDPWSQSVVSEINCRICAAVKSPSCNNYMQQQFCLKSVRFSLDSECKQLKWFLFDVHWIEMERISNRHQQIWDFYQFTNRLNVISGVSRIGAEGNNSKGAPLSYVNKSTVAVTVLTVSMLTSQLAELDTPGN